MQTSDLFYRTQKIKFGQENEEQKKTKFGEEKNDTRRKARILGLSTLIRPKERKARTMARRRIRLIKNSHKNKNKKNQKR